MFYRLPHSRGSQQMRLKYGASESSYVLRDALRRNKGQDQPHMTVAVADVKRRSPTSAELPPDVNAFDDAATWASQAGLPVVGKGAGGGSLGVYTGFSRARQVLGGVEPAASREKPTARVLKIYRRIFSCACVIYKMSVFH